MADLKITGPHQGARVVARGTPLAEAKAVLIMLHGRGALASDILTLADEIDADGVACLAPQAANYTWYPNRFIAPVRTNEPWLSSALALLGGLVAQASEAGVPTERTMLLGFSQGACLALEYAARNPRRYGAVFGLSGGLIENGDARREYTGSLAGTAVFLGCSTTDPHIPRARVERSAELLKALGADVTLRLYPHMDHTVNQDELDFVRALVQHVRGP